jgi:hypothetical protein
MTIPLLKVKVLQRPVIRGKMDVRFPSNVAVESFLTLVKANGTYTFGVDYTLIGEAPISDPTTAMVVVLDESAGTYKLQSLSALLASTAKIVQEVTSAGPVDVLPNAGIVKVNQTVGAAITLNMPLAAVKTCPVKIVDWKGDAGTNNVTVALSGSDKFQGNLTSWVLSADGASVVLDPISGGYAV